MSPGIEDLHFGASVHAADGTRIGSLRRVILDEATLDLRAIVVKETRVFSGHHIAGTGLLEDDIAIPMSAMRAVTRERIDLSITPAEARHTAPYLTYQYAPLARRDVGRMVVASVGQSGYIPHLIEEAHKRLDEIEVTRGENIMLDRTGRKLGTVRDLVTEGGEFIGVVMRPSGFFKEDVLLQVRFLGRSDDMALFAHLNESDLQHLTPFHPE